jgi:hypothetical protein
MNDYKEGSSGVGSPDRIDKGEMCQFDGITCNRNIELDVRQLFHFNASIVGDFGIPDLRGRKT